MEILATALFFGAILLLVSSQGKTSNRLERKLDVLLTQVEVDLKFATDQEIERLLKMGKKGEAVEFYSELTGTNRGKSRQYVHDFKLNLIRRKFQD